jgi:HrpA-like RNA helicase
MAAELVETNQLYARRVAKIDPRWAERAGAHLVKRSYDNIRWDPKGGRAVATEQVTLYGLPIVSDRTIGYDRVDAAGARAWFITKALIERDVADAAWLGTAEVPCSQRRVPRTSPADGGSRAPLGTRRRRDAVRLLRRSGR